MRTVYGDRRERTSRELGGWVGDVLRERDQILLKTLLVSFCYMRVQPFHIKIAVRGGWLIKSRRMGGLDYFASGWC